jgi:hypothetical protein
MSLILIYAGFLAGLIDAKTVLEEAANPVPAPLVALWSK